MPDFTDLVDLASERLGAAALYANDDFFASKDNLLKASKPVFIDGKYTDRGKWMDGWESRRKRVPGHDFCLIRLGAPGVVRGVVVDTAFFKGNYPEHCSIDAVSIEGNVTPEMLLDPSLGWTEILPKTPLAGDTQNAFGIERAQRFTHLRLNIYPDGGVARLRVYGDVLPEPRWLGRGPQAEVDLGSVENGAQVVACNDMFFGSRHNLIFPGRSVNMGDGWETKRSRRAGPDWVVVKLAAAGTLSRVEVDTNHFKGNYPESCAILACHAPGASVAEVTSDRIEWTTVLERTKLQPHTRHFYERELFAHRSATHVKLQIFPDGGVSRLRLWGTPSREGREEYGMRRIDALTESEAIAELRAVCGSQAWAQAISARRPFRTFEAMKAAADDVWRALSPSDWLEAFKAHPRIGEKKTAAAAAESASARSTAWSTEEQSKVAQADGGTLEALASANRDYEAKFGHVFLICATGKTADEMLAALQERMHHDKDAEIRVAADEQRKITQLRLEKLVIR